jgi:hypothetical protein
MGSSAESNQQISFRPMERSDFPQLQKWVAASHVAAWWNEPFDLVSLDAKFRPRILPTFQGPKGPCSLTKKRPGI